MAAMALQPHVAPQIDSTAARWRCPATVKPDYKAVTSNSEGPYASLGRGPNGGFDDKRAYFDHYWGVEWSDLSAEWRQTFSNDAVPNGIADFKCKPPKDTHDRDLFVLLTPKEAAHFRGHTQVDPSFCRKSYAFSFHTDIKGAVHWAAHISGRGRSPTLETSGSYST